jgi:hypothetical protein
VAIVVYTKIRQWWGRQKVGFLMNETFLNTLDKRKRNDEEEEHNDSDSTANDQQSKQPETKKMKFYDKNEEARPSNQEVEREPQMQDGTGLLEYLFFLHTVGKMEGDNNTMDDVDDETSEHSPARMLKHYFYSNLICRHTQHHPNNSH